MRIKIGIQQRGLPVVPQIDADEASIDCWDGSESIQRRGLEIENLWSVHLVNHRPRRPCQSVSPAVETGRHDHRLAYRGPGGSKEVVEKPCPRGDPLCREGPDHDLTVKNAGEWFQPDRPHKRFGERVIKKGVGLPGRKRPP